MSILALQSSRLGGESWLLCLVCLHVVSCVVVVWLILEMLWVCLQFVIVVFPYHTLLLFKHNLCASCETTFRKTQDSIDIHVQAKSIVNQQAQKRLYT